MLLKRLLLSISGYFLAVAAVLSVIMIVPGLAETLGQDEAAWIERLTELVRPLPDLWRILLPMALMLTVLVAFSRLSLRGEVKVWRSVGTSAWPFARAVALVGLVLGVLIVGPLWSLTKPELDEPAQRSATTWQDIEDASLWYSAPTKVTPDKLLILYSKADLATGTIMAGRVKEASGFNLTLDMEWHNSAIGMGVFGSQSFTVGLFEEATSKTFLQLKDSPTEALSWLTYRLSYPVLVMGLALIMLPLALSIDGQRWTVLKIVGGCLLALNILFLLLMSDALVRASFWSSTWFFSGRAALALCIGLLLILIFEERSA